MSKRDTMIRALCKSLGVDYRVTTIDLERVIYRDFTITEETKELYAKEYGYEETEFLAG